MGSEPDQLIAWRLAELFPEDCLVDYGPGVGAPVRGRAACRGVLAIGQ